MNKKLYKLMNWPEIEGIIYSEDDNPHRLLGPHTVGNSTLVQAFRPGAVKMELHTAAGKSYRMEQADEDGYFAALVPEKTLTGYTYRIVYEDGRTQNTADAYAFGPQITKKDTERFQAGIHYAVYEKLGAHPMRLEGVAGVYFAVWAPGALRVSAVGDFNRWDGRIHQMRRLWDSGIFEIFVPEAQIGDNYKFELKLKGGLTYLKADPYAFGQQLRPETASVIRDIEAFSWDDGEWMAGRRRAVPDKEPISVYELHLGSFRKPEEDGKPYLNYRELAPLVIKYMKEMGYTHIELMPVMEHPLDESWGYQVIGYYAPTARYGTPEDFQFFMNEMHKAGIGVILDWVPAHFPRDAYGLANFDGTCLYEHQDPRKGSHPHWGTLIYNYGRPEVSNYLIANALFWIERYHADGIRMDAVASMLYLDYGRRDGEWIPNIYGGNENLEAVEFLKHLNSIVKKRYPGVLMIAEESTAWPKITAPVEEDGLGFDLKWNMGFMNDYLGYIRNDPYFRSGHHSELTFSMIYAYSERFMLVFSHDEVVHGKGTLIGKMPGERKAQFANLRLTYAYMMLHPGKKLLFMGQDLAEYDEWKEGREVEWGLTKEKDHNGVRELVKALNHFYREHPALYRFDTSWDGFEWINCIASGECMLSFLRKTDRPEETLVIVANFANVERKFRIGVPYEGKYKEILNTDELRFGGGGKTNSRILRAEEPGCDGRDCSIRMISAPLSVSIFSFIPYTKAEQEKIARNKAAREAARKAEEAREAAEFAEKKAEEASREAKEAARKAAAEKKAAKEALKKAEAVKAAAEEAARIAGETEPLK